jgi:hypothetical protein
LISSNFIVFSLLPVSACFFFHLSGSEEKQGGTGEGNETEREGGRQGVSEGAARAKRFWFMFGATPAQSETPARAAAKRRPPGRGRSGTKDAKLPQT